MLFLIGNSFLNRPTFVGKATRGQFGNATTEGGLTLVLQPPGVAPHGGPDHDPFTQAFIRSSQKCWTKLKLGWSRSWLILSGRYLILMDFCKDKGQ